MNKYKVLIKKCDDMVDKFGLIEIRRCIYGHDRRIENDENKYTYIFPHYRKCNWCGKEEKLVEKVYTKMEWSEY